MQNAILFYCCSSPPPISSPHPHLHPKPYQALSTAEQTDELTVIWDAWRSYNVALMMMPAKAIAALVIATAVAIATSLTIADTVVTVAVTVTIFDDKFTINIQHISIMKCTRTKPPNTDIHGHGGNIDIRIIFSTLVQVFSEIWHYQ